MLLNELFNQPVKWKVMYPSDTDIEIMFQVNELRYVVKIFALLDENEKMVVPTEWSFHFIMLTPDEEFGEDGTGDITGTGNQHVVFATLVDIVKTFIQEHNPDIITTGAQELNRFKLYQRIIKNVIPTWKMITNSHPKGNTIKVINPQGRAANVIM